ncbi:hypothetical protein [Acinetobacter johnsonii]|uniref:Uncharacterized protein n=1 Tax=Acinetobacter johnsonii TaxID=40214 RepID=A0AA42MBY5_ACIJO|nr:hypothetical protein [Acinetobacter johnsonii]MDH0827538.1 hypothetical protein [Acinetobacter johnsonii]
MDVILKYLPLIIFIYPILSWLDSRKRFTHSAKFYADRAVSVKKYEEENKRADITDYEKSAFAQAMVATEKLGFKEVNILKLKSPNNFFSMVNKIKKIRHKIEVKNLGQEDVFVSIERSKTLKFKPIIYLLLYVSSVPIFISNSLLTLLFKHFGWNLFLVDANTYIFSQFVTLIVGILVAIIAAMKFINHEILTSLIKEDMIMAKVEFESIDDVRDNLQDHSSELG